MQTKCHPRPHHARHFEVLAHVQHQKTLRGGVYVFGIRAHHGVAQEKNMQMMKGAWVTLHTITSEGQMFAPHQCT
jgi:hypothetical protein